MKTTNTNALPFNERGYIRIELYKGLDGGTGSYLWQRREEKFLDFDDAEAVFEDLMLNMNNQDFPIDTEWDNKSELDMSLLNLSLELRDRN